MVRRLMLLVLLVGISGPARAGFEEGLAAFYNFDYTTALHEWIPLAEAGDSRAQYQLGLMYYRGEGLPQDYQKAALWYRRAAERGDVDAQLNLGLMYAQGLGLTQSFYEAFKWFEHQVHFEGKCFRLSEDLPPRPWAAALSNVDDLQWLREAIPE